MPYRFCVVLCVAALLGCVETQTITPVENDSQVNGNPESQRSVEDSPSESARTVPEEETEESSSTFVAVDQSNDSPVDDDPPLTQTERVEIGAGASGIPDSSPSQALSTFNSLMTRIHQAIDQEQWEEAGRLLDEASQFDPKSVAAQDLRDLVTKQLERLHQRDLGQKFTEAIHAEEWIEASKIAANLETQDSAVLEQIQRATTLIEAEQLIDRLVANPERLSRPSIQTEVSRLRNLIAGVDPGQRVGEKSKRLNEMSRRWTSPVVVNLTSDGYTTVLLRPGRSLGRFRTQTIRLMPGEYELIGRRDGFREVRRSLPLNPDDETKSVEIKANERF